MNDFKYISNNKSLIKLNTFYPKRNEESLILIERRSSRVFFPEDRCKFSNFNPIKMLNFCHLLENAIIVNFCAMASWKILI